MATDLLYCTLCERLVDVSGMTCVKDSRGGGRGYGRGRATYFDRAKRLAHVVLSGEASKKFQPVVKEEVPAAPAQPVETEAPAALEVIEAQVQTPAVPEPVAQEPEGPWVPQPGEWYMAVITQPFPSRDYAFAELTNGDEVFIFLGKVNFHSGSHRCLYAGDDVSVRIQPSSPSRLSPWSALECTSQTPHVFPDAEDAVVIKWQGMSGFVQRTTCGCTIGVLLHESNFTYLPNIEAGDRVIVSGIEQRANTRSCNGWVARQIEEAPQEDEL